MWQQEMIFQDLKDASIIHLYQLMGKRLTCDNHRGISSLATVGKSHSWILLNRLIALLDQGL